MGMTTKAMQQHQETFEVVETQPARPEDEANFAMTTEELVRLLEGPMAGNKLPVFVSDRSGSWQRPVIGAIVAAIPGKGVRLKLVFRDE